MGDAKGSSAFDAAINPASELPVDLAALKGRNDVSLDRIAWNTPGYAKEYVYGAPEDLSLGELALRIRREQGWNSTETARFFAKLLGIDVDKAYHGIHATERGPRKYRRGSSKEKSPIDWDKPAGTYLEDAPMDVSLRNYAAGLASQTPTRGRGAFYKEFATRLGIKDFSVQARLEGLVTEYGGSEASAPTTAARAETSDDAGKTDDSDNETTGSKFGIDWTEPASVYLDEAPEDGMSLVEYVAREEDRAVVQGGQKKVVHRKYADLLGTSVSNVRNRISDFRKSRASRAASTHTASTATPAKTVDSAETGQTATDPDEAARSASVEPVAPAEPEPAPAPPAAATEPTQATLLEEPIISSCQFVDVKSFMSEAAEQGFPKIGETLFRFLDENNLLDSFFTYADANGQAGILIGLRCYVAGCESARARQAQ